MTLAVSEAEERALRQAIALAADSGITLGPNPAVGCVLLDSSGRAIASGWHRGPGTPHAEVEALGQAGAAASGATAVVSMEPCSHHGRTPPCTAALLAAGVTRVVYGQADPNPQAAGGADVLRAAGVEVVGPAAPAAAQAVNRDWNAAQVLRRPLVHWKVAASLDGRIAAADGTSKWITSPQSREVVHAMRAAVDAVLTGTGTALADSPQLTARPGGVAAARQPLRAVMGMTPMPGGHPLANAALLRTHDPAVALAQLWDLDARRVMLECGPRLAGAFATADLIDRVTWFAAPLLLGDDGLAVLDGGPATLADAKRWRVLEVAASGPDVRVELERKEW